MVVLRVGEREGIRADAVAQVGEIQPNDLAQAPIAGSLAQVQMRNDDPLADDLLRESQLAIELERAGLHDHRARLLAGTGGVGDDAQRHAAPGEVQREDEPRGAGSHNQNPRRTHWRLVRAQATVTSSVSPPDCSGG